MTSSLHISAWHGAVSFLPSLCCCCCYCCRCCCCCCCCCCCYCCCCCRDLLGKSFFRNFIKQSLPSLRRIRTKPRTIPGFSSDAAQAISTLVTLFQFSLKFRRLQRRPAERNVLEISATFWRQRGNGDHAFYLLQWLAVGTKYCTSFNVQFPLHILYNNAGKCSSWTTGCERCI